MSVHNFSTAKAHTFVGKALRGSSIGQENSSKDMGLLAFISLLLGALVSYLWKGELFSKIALGLITASIVFWIVALIMHGSKKTRIAPLGKIFFLLFLMGLGREILALQSGGEDIFSWETPTVQAPSVGEKDTMHQTNTTNIAHTQTGIVNGETGQKKNDTTTPITEITSGKDTLPIAISATGKDSLTFGQVVPLLVNTYNLDKTSGGTTSFKHITSTDPLYSYFKAGYQRGLIGTNTNPSNKVSCDVYIVMIGLAQGWKVQYPVGNPFAAYYAEASKRNQTFDCQRGSYVTAANLPQ